MKTKIIIFYSLRKNPLIPCVTTRFTLIGLANIFCLLPFAFSLLTSFALCLSSCSSSTHQENKTPSEKAVATDTSLNGVTGIIEKKPPVVNGEYITKYPSGVVKMKGFYIKGKREGQWNSFFENGNIQSEGFFKDGLRDGKALVYYENGKLYYEGYYSQGKEVGKWIFYDVQGNKVNEKDYGNKPNS